MKFNQPTISRRLSISILFLLTASLLLPFIQLTSAMIFVLLGFSIYHYSLNLNRKGGLGISMWAMVFYFILIIGITYSENKPAGLKVLEGTASFVAFPIIFMNKDLSSERIKKYVVNIFLTATFLFCFYTYIKSFFFPKEYFYNNTLTFGFIHHTYLGVYCSFTIIIGLDRLINATNLKLKFLYVLVVLFLAYYLLILGARTSLFATVLVVTIYLLSSPAIRPKLKRYTFILLILIFGLAALVVSTDKKLKYRYYHLFEKSLDNRMNLWQASLSIIKENPFFGVGTGDASTELLKEYKQREFHEPYKRKYNAHNQFLDTIIRIGLVGFLPLAIYLASTLYIASKKMELLHVAFLSIILIACFTEVLLIRQKGIVFFLLFNSLFLSHGEKE